MKDGRLLICRRGVGEAAREIRVKQAVEKMFTGFAAAVQVAQGGGGGPGGGVTVFGLVAGMLAAFLGGIGLSAFALRRRGAH